MFGRGRESGEREDCKVAVHAGYLALGHGEEELFRAVLVVVRGGLDQLSDHQHEVISPAAKCHEGLVIVESHGLLSHTINNITKTMKQRNRRRRDRRQL